MVLGINGDQILVVARAMALALVAVLCRGKKAFSDNVLLFLATCQSGLIGDV